MRAFYLDSPSGLLIDRWLQVKEQKRKVEALKKAEDAKNYLDKDKAVEHKNKGNEFFK